MPEINKKLMRERNFLINKEHKIKGFIVLANARKKQGNIYESSESKYHRNNLENSEKTTKEQRQFAQVRAKKNRNGTEINCDKLQTSNVGKMLHLIDVLSQELDE